MNENNQNPTQPNSDHIMRQQSDDVFVLIQIVNSLCEEAKVGDLGSAQFMRHMLSEIRWLQEQSKRINDSVNSFLNMHPDHIQARTLCHLLDQTTTQIEDTKETYRQLALSAFNKPHLLPQYQNRLQTLFHRLHLLLNQLQKQLWRLDQNIQTVAGD
jgi:hypothetical protein